MILNELNIAHVCVYQKGITRILHTNLNFEKVPFTHCQNCSDIAG